MLFPQMSPAQKIANFIAAKTGAPAETSPPPAHPAETLEATTFQPDAPESEAHRIAAELVRLHRDGAIASQKDASFYAHLLRDFDATYTGPVSNIHADVRQAPMCRLPCSSFASLAGSPWRNGGAFCRRISTTWLA